MSRTHETTHDGTDDTGRRRHDPIDFASKPWMAAGWVAPALAFPVPRWW